MRVLAYLLNYPPGRYIGSELMTASLLEALVADGHDVTVAVEQGCDPYTRRGVHVMPRRVVSMSQTAHLDYDLFISHPEIADMIYNRVKGTPYLAVVHNSRDMVRDGLYKRMPRHVVYNSDQMAAEMSAYCPEAAWTVIRPPVRPEAHVPAKPYARQFVTVVNLTEDKGADVFWWLAEERPDVQFLGVLGGYGEQIVHDDRPNVWLAGQTPHLAPLFAQTRVLLVPSRHESYGMTGVEAAVSGCAVIVSDLPGPREALGEAADYADPEDPEQWLVALDRVLAAPDARARARRDLAKTVHGRTEEDTASWVRLCRALARTR